jgi:hypothetical protein
MHRVVVKVGSEKSASLVKEAFEKMYPMLDGSIYVTKDPEITTLDKVIEQMQSKKYNGSV